MLEGGQMEFERFTTDAKRRWEQVPEWAKKEIMDAAWCTNCRTGTPMQLRGGEMSHRSLILNGVCKKCGGEVSRLIEPVEG